MEGLGKLVLGLGAQAEIALDRYKAGGDPGPTGITPEAVLSKIGKLGTRGAAARYLQGVHQKVLAHRASPGSAVAGPGPG